MGKGEGGCVYAMLRKGVWIGDTLSICTTRPDVPLSDSARLELDMCMWGCTTARGLRDVQGLQEKWRWGLQRNSEARELDGRLTGIGGLSVGWCFGTQGSMDCLAWDLGAEEWLIPGQHLGCPFVG